MTDPTPVDRLEAGIADLHVPAPDADRERLLLATGFVLAVAGVIAVVLGWYGASGTRDVTNQIPYLISGGLIGLALVTGGVGLVLRFSLARLFRFWLARLLAEHQVQTDRTVDALGRIEALLAAQAGATGAAAPAAPADPPTVAAAPPVS